MRLTELEPRFLKYIENTRGIFHREVKTLAAAQGVIFVCPKCYAAKGGRRGVHSVICWSSSRGVPAHAQPGPGRWRLTGTGFHNLTLDCEPGKSRSVLLLGGCAWHGYVTNGEVTSC